MTARLILGHGASGTAATMAPYVSGLAARGIEARAVDLPRGRNAAAVEVFLAAARDDPGLALGGHSFGGRMASLAAAELSRALREGAGTVRGAAGTVRGAAGTAREAARTARDGAEAARDGAEAAHEPIATAATGNAAVATRPAALVCFSYPLHRPGAPEAETRTAHWPDIDCPVLLLSGDRDPFTRIDLLRAAVSRLRDVELIVFNGDRHGLPLHRDEALDAAADFLRRRT
ncbi:MAG TPA: alpha/beta fold hydrolase [Candidatus Limnocylindrales bacterium]|nr:alpha/beta fold hydrolase [Candidatus Limnocylindrales bacterium]